MGDRLCAPVIGWINKRELMQWLNTVPYKPVSNRAWSMAAKRRFQSSMAELLLDAWQARGGEHTVIALGREAYFWFEIGQPAEVGAALDSFWALGNARAAAQATHFAMVRRFPC